RADVERSLRSLALGAAAALAFLPAALLADGDVPARVALRNAAVVLGLTLLPAFVSSHAERSPDAEDMPRARWAFRLSPLAPAALALLSLLFPFVLRWHAVEVALLLQAGLALNLEVPRVRACHLLVTGWGALASALLDE